MMKKYTGTILILDEVDDILERNTKLVKFSKDCKVALPENCPLTFGINGDPIGSCENFRKSNNRIIFDVQIPESDALKVLNKQYNGNIPVGGFYTNVKRHDEMIFNGDPIDLVDGIGIHEAAKPVDVIDEATLRNVSISLLPANSKLTIHEKKGE